MYLLLSELVGARVGLAALDKQTHDELAQFIDRLYNLDVAVGEAKALYLTDREAGRGALAKLHQKPQFSTTACLKASQLLEPFTSVLDPRGQPPRAGLGSSTCSMPSYDRALWTLRIWLDSWSGIGHVAVGMPRQGFDLQSTQCDGRGWRATFYTSGMEHSPTSATGTGWERTPWHATQRAAWDCEEGQGVRL